MGQVIRLCLLIFSCCFGLQSVSLAQAPAAEDPPGYRPLIDAALLEYDTQNYLEARALFSRAHQIFPNARTHRALGMADFELHDYVGSSSHLKAALESNIRPLDAQTRAATEALYARAEGFLGRIRMRVRPLDVTVLVDGKTVSLDAGDALLLPAGEHVVEVSAEGYAKETRHLKTEPGQNEELVVTLHRFDSKGEAKPLYKNPWLWTGVGVVAVAGAVVGTWLATRTNDNGKTNEMPVDGTIVTGMVGGSR